MLGLRQLLKKENGTCPICAIPYIRGRRSLKAGYFDLSYDVTAWTARCPECGYEVIMPGTARIQAAETPQQDTGTRWDDTAQAMITVTGPDMPDTEPDWAMTDADAKDEGSHPGAEKGSMDAAGAGECAAGAAGPAKASDTDPCRDAPVADADMAGHRSDAGADAEPKADAKDARDTASAVPPAQGDADGTGKTGKADTADTAPTTGADADAAGHPKSGGDGPKPDKAAKPVPAAELASSDNGVPAATGKRGGPEKAGGPAEPAEGHHDTAKAAQEEAAGRPKEPLKDKGPEDAGKAAARESMKAGGNTAGNKDKGTGGQARPDKKPMQEKATQGKSPQEKVPNGQERKKQPQKGAGELRKKQQAPQAAPPPAPRPGQSGAFPGRGPSGFPGSGMFPSSALSNLEALRASVQPPQDKKSSGKKEDARTPSKTHGEAAPGPAKDKGAGAGSTAGKAQPPADTKAKASGKPDRIQGGTDILAAMCRPDSPMAPHQPDKAAALHQADRLADNGKPGESPNDKKTLSAEKTSEGGVAKPAPRDNKPAEACGKTLSAENGEETKAVKEAKAPGKVKEAGDGSVATPGKDAPKHEKEAAGSTGKDKTEVKKSDVDAAKELEAKEAKGTSEAAKADGTRDTEKAEEADEATGSQDGGQSQQDPMEGAKAAAKKIQEKIPAGIAEKIPILSQISKQQKKSLFMGEEKRYLEEHVPHKQSIINDLIYDTDNSEMFLRVNGQYGLDRPCVHYNYRTQNGNFFRCTVKYKQDDSIRVLDVMEAKRMLEDHPDLYKKFFPESVADA